MVLLHSCFQPAFLLLIRMTSFIHTLLTLRHGQMQCEKISNSLDKEETLQGYSPYFQMLSQLFQV